MLDLSNSITVPQLCVAISNLHVPISLVLVKKLHKKELRQALLYGLNLRFSDDAFIQFVYKYVMFQPHEKYSDRQLLLSYKWTPLHDYVVVHFRVVRKLAIDSINDTGSGIFRPVPLPVKPAGDNNDSSNSLNNDTTANNNDGNLD